MRKYISFVLIASISLLYLFSCDGGDGQGEGEFTVFDVFLNPDLSGCNLNVAPQVPSNELKLSLNIRGRKISGSGELLAFGNIGEADRVRGSTENDELSLKPFQVNVESNPAPEDTMEPGPSSVSYSFNDF